MSENPYPKLWIARQAWNEGWAARDAAASPDERLREALDNLLAAVTDVERRGGAGLIEALDDAVNDAADLLAAADREKPDGCRAPHCWSEYGTPCGTCPAEKPETP